jgi:hypothetical protein
MKFGGWELKSGNEPPIALFGKGVRVHIYYYLLISYSSVYHILSLISRKIGMQNDGLAIGVH